MNRRGGPALRQHRRLTLPVPMRFLFVLALCLPAFAVHAQTNSVTVAIAERPPFAMRDEALGWRGIAVDLWRQIAEERGIAYEVIDVDDPIEALRNGSATVALPTEAVPDTDTIAFSQPFYTANVALAKSRTAGLLRVASNVLSWQFLRVVLFLSALLLIVGAVVWLIERRANDEMFPTDTKRGLGAGFWWAGVTMTTIGYGDKAPVTPLGRAVALLWMLVAMIVTAALTATLVSAVGLAGGTSLPSQIEGRIGVAVDSPAAAYAAAANVDFETFDTLDEAVARLGDGLDGVLGNEPHLRHLIKSDGSPDLAITSSTIDPQYVSIATTDREFLRTVDEAILKRLPTPAWWELTQSYLPGDE